MQQRAFEQRLAELLRADVLGVSFEDKLALVETHASALRANRRLEGFRATFQPFVPGRRPQDEASYPGLGSSEQVGLLHRGRTEPDAIVFLVRCHDGAAPVAGFPAGASVLGTIERLDHAGRVSGSLPGWERRDLRPLLEPVAGGPGAAPSALAQALRLDVGGTFLASDFASQFHHRFRMSLDVVVDGARLTGDVHEFEIHNEELFGSLYQRMVDVLLPADTARQGSAVGVQPSIDRHPWYPVLSIGMQKARFYMGAIAGDLIDQKRMLTDPGWLLRVGLYLELLTCLGVAEAVRDEIDILTPAERRAFEEAPQYEEIRKRIDVPAWKKVWSLRAIAFGGGAEVGPLNLMRKKNATLAFLHAHHEDLLHAIELAGPNLHNAQETWHRVFRDAERAVLKMNADAFPELAQLSDGVKDFVLWHQSGRLGGVRFMPRQVTEVFGDQDGIFPSACRQYRASMNKVATWARGRGLMEYTGSECVPASASLLEAYLGGQQGRLAGLQRRDGFVAGSLEVEVETAARPELSHEAIAELLRRVEVLSVFSVDEVQALARQVRPIRLGHLERILIQGHSGSSLFILQEGILEVIGNEAGVERQLALLQPPAVIGEWAFLSGEKRAATVRALDEATVLEVSAALLRPLVEQRPALLEKLYALLEDRQSREQRPPRPSMFASLRRSISAAERPLTPADHAHARPAHCSSALWPNSNWSLWLQRPQPLPTNIAFAVASPFSMYCHQATVMPITRSGCSMRTRWPVALPPVSSTWW